MSQLADPIECEAEIVVTEGAIEIEVYFLGDAYFHFVLSLAVCYDLPVVLSVLEGLAPKDRSKLVVFLFKEKSEPVLSDAHLVRRLAGVPVPPDEF